MTEPYPPISKQTPHLCGGIYFSLLVPVIAVGKHPTHREIVTNLAKVVSDDIQISKGEDAFKTGVSAFKACKYSEDFVFYTPSFQKSFRHAMQNQKPQLVYRMNDFISKNFHFEDMEAIHKLVRMLLKIINEDDSILPDYIFQIGKGISKLDLCHSDHLDLGEFLLGTFYFSITERKNNVGLDTYTNWYPIHKENGIEVPGQVRSMRTDLNWDFSEPTIYFNGNPLTGNNKNIAVNYTSIQEHTASAAAEMEQPSQERKTAEESANHVTEQTTLASVENPAQSMATNSIPVMQQVPAVHNINNFYGGQVTYNENNYGPHFLRPAIPDRNYYNLVVAEDIVGTNGTTVIDRQDAIVNQVFTDEQIKMQFADLDPEDISRIECFPTLILQVMDPTDFPRDPLHDIYFGWIDNIQISTDAVLISWHGEFPLRYEQIHDLLRPLDIKDEQIIGELTIPHWAIKGKDLISILHQRGVTVL